MFELKSLNEMSKKTTLVAVVAFVLYVGSIVGANYMIGHIGKVIPGAHVLPVGFGLYAPSGVYLASLALVSRDLLQRSAGTLPGIVAILVGAFISYFISSPQLAFASGFTFLVSETVDFAIFTPLAKRNFAAAVLVSGLFGEFVDSVLFLTLAQIPLSIALKGQLVGKMWVILLGSAISFILRRSSLLAPQPRVESINSLPAK
ncbi:MAG: VUT family protein [Actinomycetota bacterium]|nr:VUT family protein [Actinomycetota bacterium]